MFLKNLNLEQFEQLTKEKEEIKIKEETVENKKMAIVSYMIVKKDTFDIPLAREAKGISFDVKTGKCISRPFHKFFNVDENKYSKRENINWKKARLSEKWDGSMAIPVIIKERIYWKTKKSFYSDVAVMINEYWGKMNTVIRVKLSRLIYGCHEKNCTPIFEFISPKNRIVIRYNKPSLEHIATRNNLSGEYVFYPGDSTLYNTYGKNVFDEIKEMERIEGYVIWDEKDFFKVKTNWYFERHKVLTGLSAKFIINATLNEEIDDVISFLKQMRLDDKAKEVEIERDRVVKEYLLRYNFSHSCFEDIKHIKDRKAFAGEVFGKYKALSSYLFKLYDGRQIDELVKKDVARDMIKIIRNLDMKK